MRAAVFTVGGPARDVLEVREVPRPEPGHGEVRVAIALTGINPTDVRARADAGPVGPGEYRIPHQDGSGLVDAIGPGVEGLEVGSRVWVFHAAHGRPHGAAAEYVCLPREQVVVIPDGVDLAVGACLGVSYLTAHLCAFDREARPREGGDQGWALVTGGAGAVGAAAVQLLRWSGARVIATASTEKKALAARQAGAEAVIRYRDEPVAERLAEIAPEGIARVVDVALASNLAHYAAALAPGAVVAAYAGGSTRPELPMRELMRRNATLRFVHVYGAPDPRLHVAIADITAALEDGAIAPVATQVLPLDRIAEAHEAVEAGPFGRVLVSVRGSG